jgi:hypothetical protein
MPEEKNTCGAEVFGFAFSLLQRFTKTLQELPKLQ